MKRIFALAVAALIVLSLIVALANPGSASTYHVPVKRPGIEVITDGMPTHLRFLANSTTKTVKVDVRTGGGKDRILWFYDGVKLVKKIRVGAFHNTPGRYETSFKMTGRRVHVKVQEQMFLKRWFGNGSANVKLW